MLLLCDPSVDTLLHLHKRREYKAKRGANADPTLGSAGPKRSEGLRKAATAPMVIPVPPGTVVKKKGSGTVGAASGGAPAALAQGRPAGPATLPAS